MYLISMSNINITNIYVPVDKSCQIMLLTYCDFRQTFN